MALVAQPSIDFLNGRFYSDGSPTEDTEDCLGRITVGLTRSKSLTVLVSPLDMLGLMGMAQVWQPSHTASKECAEGRPHGNGRTLTLTQCWRTKPKWPDGP